MNGVVFVRRLREGKTYEDFRAAWYPDEGFGVPARVLAGATLVDPRTIVTVGFVDADPARRGRAGLPVGHAGTLKLAWETKRQ
jgi:hypothetical protein